MRNLAGSVIDDHIRTEFNQYVAVDIDRVFTISSKRVRLAYSSRIIAIEIEICVYIIFCFLPVIYVKTKVTCIGYRPDGICAIYVKQVNIIPTISTGRVHITVLPVEHHRVGTSVTGRLLQDQFHLQLIVRLETDISGNRILGNITVQQAIYEGRSSTLEIEGVSGFLECFLDQLTNRLGSIMVTAALIDRTLTNRHCAIHLVLEREGSFDRSCAVDFVCQLSIIRVNVVVLHVRNTNLIPVLLVITRNNILYIRNEQFSLSLLRINCLCRIVAEELRLEYERIGRTEFDIELTVTYTIDSLCRHVM